MEGPSESPTLRYIREGPRKGAFACVRGERVDEFTGFDASAGKPMRMVQLLEGRGRGTALADPLPFSRDAIFREMKSFAHATP